MDYLLNNIVAMAISSYHSTPLLEHIFANKSFCLFFLLNLTLKMFEDGTNWIIFLCFL